MNAQTKTMYFLLLLTLMSDPVCKAQSVDASKAMLVVATHLENALSNNKYAFVYPRSSNPDGTVKMVKSSDWTSGFFVGNLWLMYEFTRDEKWMAAAKKWAVGLEQEKLNTHTHDLGFMLYCSFGNGYRLTGNEEYKAILIQGARSLCTRFNERAGVIKSWDHGSWQFPVIIDNMMNLELLFWATKVTGDSSFYKIALTHATTTLRNHFRPDNSSYHVVDYDTLTGKVLRRVTHQGFADESAWARGQVWGLYGYTVAYRETHDRHFLDKAIAIANFLLSHPNMPKDLIPYWDFNSTSIPNDHRDASAAAILASALLELHQYSSMDHGYYRSAEKILQKLSSPEYLAATGTNNNFVLKHSVGHKPAKSEVDVPLIYADYYYIEALTRYSQSKKSQPSQK